MADDAKRTELISCRVTERMALDMLRLASSRDRSVSEYCYRALRNCMYGEIVKLDSAAEQANIVCTKVNMLRDLTPAELDSLYEARRCPFCCGDEFMRGPQGGLCTNWRCAKCGAGFNLGPIPSFGQLINEPATDKRAATSLQQQC